MTELIYHKVLPISREKAEKAFAGNDPVKITNALLSLAYFDPDWRYVRNLCMQLLNDNSTQNRYIAAVCLGHVARIHKKSELREDIPLLEILVADPEIGGTVENTIEDIKMFTRKKRVSLKK